MRIFEISRAFRAVLLAWAMISFAPAAGLAAGALISPGTLHSMERSAEPFGLLVLTAGDLREKWLAVQRRLDDEMLQLALCEVGRLPASKAKTIENAELALDHALSPRKLRLVPPSD